MVPPPGEPQWQLQALPRAAEGYRAAPVAAHSGRTQVVYFGATRQEFRSVARLTHGLSRSPRPNPSIKPSPNSKMPGPACRYAVHFRQPGPGILLSVPAYVER